MSDAERLGAHAQGFLFAWCLSLHYTSETIYWIAMAQYAVLVASWLYRRLRRRA